MSHIPRTPTAPPASSPHDPRYYDARDLEAELRRTFQVCHECRMCVSYCDAFPEVFRRVDRDIEAGRAVGAELIDERDIRAVSDQCWQCKLCYIKCPYTKADGAHELLDFPRLMARERAARARRDGVSLVDRLLGEPQLLGALGSGLGSRAGNLIQRNRLLRKVQEKVTGISGEFPLPSFASQAFPRWMRHHQPASSAGERGEVVLFATCYGNFNAPSVPRAAVRVLEHVGYRVRTVAETCCGMPNLDGGDVTGAEAKIRANAKALVEHVKAGAKVVVPSPTCGYMMKAEWPEYVPEDDVRAVAAATLDLMELIEQLRKVNALPPVERNTSLGKLAYHAPCHLRAQKIGAPGARVLARALPDTEVEIIEECSAVDGTWGMKAAHYETGRRYAKRLLRDTSATEPDLVVSDCPLSALRIRHENGSPVLHSIEALAKGFGLNESDST